MCVCIIYIAGSATNWVYGDLTSDKAWSCTARESPLRETQMTWLLSLHEILSLSTPGLVKKCNSIFLWGFPFYCYFCYLLSDVPRLFKVVIIQTLRASKSAIVYQYAWFSRTIKKVKGKGKHSIGQMKIYITLLFQISNGWLGQNTV